MKSLQELAKYLGVTAVTLQRDKTRAGEGIGCSNLARVEKLSKVFGIDERKFLYPAKYGNPWPVVYLILKGVTNDQITQESTGKPRFQKRPLV